jgi:hypothetical protein
MQLTILGVLAIGGGLLFIYIALNRKPAGKAEKAASGESAPEGGKVIYLFGSEGGQGRSEPNGAASGPDGSARGVKDENGKDGGQ